MNTILLQPTDVLFFRDGRPMGGASSGHGAAWPLPTVTDAALHAALHRAGGGLREKAHHHKHNHDGKRERPFGSVTHAGPFPVDGKGRWFFPRPLDLLDATLAPALLPLLPLSGAASSLPKPLRFACANRLPPSKEYAAKAWLSQNAWENYIHGKREEALEKDDAVNDTDFADTEYTIGIGIDPSSGTQNGTQFYSAQYLRLREGWRIGLMANSKEKQNGDRNNRSDIIGDLFKNSDITPAIIVGGQQRICSAKCDHITHNQALPLPQGMTQGFKPLDNGHFAVKWVLLTPALFPYLPAEIRSSGEGEAKKRDSGKPHPGGWLPSWIDPDNGEVELLDGPGGKKAERLGLKAGEKIAARLVAAVTGKAVAVTGWALAHDAADRTEGGAKPAQLAVPAGSVYYFEAYTKEAAEKLAAALNWHGNATGNAAQTIVNRRSALCGEKGFGIGVCGTWHPYANDKAHPSCTETL